MSVENPDFDRKLERLFDLSQEDLAGEAFRAEIERQLWHMRRAALTRRIAVCVLLVASLAVSTPLIVHESMRFSGYVSDAVPTFGNALVTPVGWVASVLLALWVLRRLRVFWR